MSKKKHKLKVSVVISGYVNELVAKLHKEYPNTERSGIARVEKREGHYLVTDIRFPKQSNSSGNTEIKDGGLDELLEDIFNTAPEQLGEWKCRIHSHHSMSCFRSGTDEEAKASFNDGNMDYRWSIVTAYKGNTIDYKCALNVFKPVNMEFNIPVTQEQFDLEHYMKMYGQDYTLYNKQYTTLESQRDLQLEVLANEQEPSDDEMTKLIEIFNVDTTEENLSVVYSLLKKGLEGNKKQKLEAIQEQFEEGVSDLEDIFEIDFFSEKLKELADNIIKPTYLNSRGGNNFMGNSLFDPEIDDTKYKNNTKKNLDRSKPFNYLGGYGHERDM